MQIMRIESRWKIRVRGLPAAWGYRTGPPQLALGRDALYVKEAHVNGVEPAQGLQIQRKRFS